MSAIAPFPSIDLEIALARLAGLPLTKPAEAESQLLALLDDLLASPPPPAILFDILEQSRESLCFLRELAAHQLHQAAPHFDAQEEERFQRGLATWQKMSAAYGLCVDDAARGNAAALAADPDRAGHAAVTLHRCLYYTGMFIVDHYRAKREIPGGTWLRFHGHYARAEALALADIPVADGLLEEERNSSSCRHIYTVHLLLEIARPYSRDYRDLNRIWHWAAQEAGLVRLGPSRGQARRPSFLVLLDGDAPLQPGTDHLADREDGRCLDTSALVLKFGQALEMLKRGHTPAWLGTDEDDAGQSRRLLKQLYHTWSLTAALRRFRRQRSNGTALVCLGFNAMHYFIQLTNWGSVAAPAGKGQPRIEYRTEEWQVVDEGPSGFRLACDNAGVQPKVRQLVAFMPHDGTHFLLAQICWLKREQSGRLVIGLDVLPGIPRAMSIEIDSRLKGQHAMRARAFFLPEVAAMRTAASIVIPSGMFAPGQTLGTDLDGCRHLALHDLIQKGSDFERAHFRRA